MLFPLYLLLLLAAVLHMWHFYPLLPDQLATRFGTDGTPNAWMSRDFFFAFYLGFLLFMSTVFLAASGFMRRMPDRFINIPNKAYWLAPERRDASLKRLGRDTAILGLISGGFIILMHHMLIRMSLAGVYKLDTPVFLVGVGLFSACVLVFVIRQYTQFRKPAA